MIHHVVVHERGQVHGLDCHGQEQGVLRDASRNLRRQEHKRRSQTLAARLDRLPRGRAQRVGCVAAEVKEALFHVAQLARHEVGGRLHGRGGGCEGGGSHERRRRQATASGQEWPSHNGARQRSGVDAGNICVTEAG